MKKLLSIFFLILLVGCSQVSEEQKTYDKYLAVLMQNETITSNDELPFDVDIKVNEDSIKEFHYEFIITNPQVAFDDLKIAILPIDFQSDEIIPTFNILEEVDISTFNQKKSGIKLNYFSQHKYVKFKMLVEHNDKQQVFMIEK